jgi:hypothetical protein
LARVIIQQAGMWLKGFPAIFSLKFQYERLCFYKIVKHVIYNLGAILTILHVEYEPTQRKKIVREMTHL